MQKQVLKYIQTPSTYYVSKTPEKKINTSPFRGYSFSDKQSITPNKYNYPGYPQIQQTINQSMQPQFPFCENTNTSIQETKEQLYQRILNMEANLKVIKQQCEQLKEDLERERNKKYETDGKYSQLWQKYMDQEIELKKQKSIVKLNEDKLKQTQRDIQEQNTIQEKFQKIVKQKEKEINDLKQKLKEEIVSRGNENDRLIQQFTQTYRDLSQQNDQLISENNDLKTVFLEFQNQTNSLSSKRQSEINIDFLDDPELRQILKEYLINNDEYYLNQIPEKQLKTAIVFLKDMYESVSSKKLKEMKSQKFQQPKQINEEIEINLQGLRKKREFLIKEIKQKMEKIVNSQEFNLKEQNELQREIEELLNEKSCVENIIQQIEQQLILNPHRNSCVSFDNEEFQ